MRGRSTENAAIYHVLVQGMDWGRRFLTEVMRLATMPNEASSREGAGLKPRFGIRFLGADTMDVLLDPHAGPGRAGLLVSWRDSSGRPRRAAALMPFLYQGDPDSDATLQSLKRAPMRN